MRGKTKQSDDAALKERSARITEPEVEIAERLHTEIDEFHREGDEQRIGFDLQLADARNVKGSTYPPSPP